MATNFDFAGVGSQILSYIFAFIFGAAVGVSELVSRYKDAPVRALRSHAASFYVALNASASVGALYLIESMNWFADLSTDWNKELIWRTLIASFGAMAFFRSSLFTVRSHGTDISMGPAGFLQVVLAAADRATDRNRAMPRARAVSAIMNNISFDKAKEALPSLCFGLMQNVGTEEQRTFGLVVKDLQNSQMDDVFKANNLGLALMNIVGEEVLREAVSVLRKLISDPPKQVVQSILTLQLLKNLNFDMQSEQLVDQCLLVSGQTQQAGYHDVLVAQVDAIGKMKLETVQKGLLLSALLINEFSEEIVQSVLKALPGNESISMAPPRPPVITKPATDPTGTPAPTAATTPPPAAAAEGGS